MSVFSAVKDQAPSGRSLVTNRVTGALGAGDIAEAENLLRTHLLRAPKDIGAMAKLAELASSRGDLDQAITMLRRALAIAPEEGMLTLKLALIYQQQGNLSAAIECIEQVPPTLRMNFDVKLQEADILGQFGRRERQVALYEELLREQPRHFRLLLSLSDALNAVGRNREAVRRLRRAIGIKPASGEPWWRLANLKSFCFDQRDIRAMERSLGSDLTNDDAINFHFALGRALEQRGDHASSFAHYDHGNRLKADFIPPPQMLVSDFVDAAIASFRKPLFNRHQRAGSAGGPIFIVGLQRSGSTLIEQILSSHPLIEGTTELVAMQSIWSEIGQRSAGGNAFSDLARMDARQLQRIGEDYLERTAAFRCEGRPLFIDKLPANWLNLGLIRLALPNARIIDARRHPMACGFSNFKQLYGVGVNYAYSLSSIGAFYRDYLRMMNHFDAVQPGAVLHVVNERLIDDPEGQIRRLLDFVGVADDPACLDFHRSRRAVNTPSAEQVRKPINRDGVDAWRPYEEWLDPLKLALGPALTEWMPATY